MKVAVFMSVFVVTLSEVWSGVVPQSNSFTSYASSYTLQSCQVDCRDLGYYYADIREACCSCFSAPITQSSFPSAVSQPSVYYITNNNYNVNYQNTVNNDNDDRDGRQTQYQTQNTYPQWGGYLWNLYQYKTNLLSSLWNYKTSYIG